MRGRKPTQILNKNRLVEIIQFTVLLKSDVNPSRVSICGKYKT